MPNQGVGSLAVYTVLYPAALAYFEAFWASLRPQLTPGLDVFFSLDAVSESEVHAAMGGAHPDVRFLPAAAGATPAQLRSAALAQLTGAYEGVILVDADDMLLPGRLTAAAAGLERADVHACAMRIVDAAGAPVPGALFSPSQAQVDSLASGPELLARVNVFGFGNSAYRSAVLAACLPVPAEAVMMDWLVASRAYLAGARFSFDLEPGMLYRQHGQNDASVLPPFSPERVARDAGLVAAHHALLLDGPRAAAREVAPFERARDLSAGFLAWLGGAGSEAGGEPEAEDAGRRAIAKGARAAAYAARLATVARRDWLWWEHVAATPDNGAYAPPHYR